MNAYKIYLAFMAVTLLTYTQIMGGGFNTGFTLICGIISLVTFLLTAVLARFLNPNKGYLTLMNLFGVGYIVVYFHYPSVAYFVEEIRELDRLWLGYMKVNQAVGLAAVCYQLVNLGYIVGLTRFRPPKSKKSTAIASPEHLIQICNSLPLITSVVLGLFLANVGREYLQGAYAGSGNWSTISRYIYKLFTILFYMTLAMELYKYKVKPMRRSLFGFMLSMNKLALLLSLFILGFNIYTGDRGPIISTALALLAGYDFFVKPFNILMVFLMVLVGAVSMNYIGRYRTPDATMTIEQRMEMAKERMQDNHWYDVPRDLAFNVSTLVLAQEIIPEQYPYFKGKIQAGQVIGVIPMTRGILRKFNVDTLGATSSNFFTTVLLGPGSKIGLGSNIIADIYIDFGRWGCLIIITFMGVFLGKLEQKASTSMSIYWNVTYVILLTYSVYWSRGLLLGQLTNVCWTLVILYGLHRTVMGGEHIYERLQRLRPSRTRISA